MKRQDMHIDETGEYNYKDYKAAMNSIYGKAVSDHDKNYNILSTPKGSYPSYKDTFNDYMEEQRKAKKVEMKRRRREKNLNIIQLEKNPRKSQENKDV